MSESKLCPIPGCGLEMDEQLTRCLDADGNAEVAYVCPRNADAHALCAKLAESEAKAKDLEAKLEVYERDLCCECEGRVELRWVCLDCHAQSEQSPREEARKKGAEHGE